MKEKNKQEKGKKASNERTAEHCRGDTGNSAVNERRTEETRVFKK